MITYLNNFNLSIDSKNLVNKKYWNKLSDEKVRIIYSAVKSSKEKSKNYFDIKINKEFIVKNSGQIDILTYSFPCQDLSLQGLQKGMAKKSSTRSSLLWEIDELLNCYFQNDKNKLPKVLLLENVKNICSKNHFEELKKWLKNLSKYGYINNYGILNSKDFGSHQSRERFFCISSLKKEIPLPKGDNKNWKPFNKIVEKTIPKKYSINYIKEHHNKNFKDNNNSKISKLELDNFTKYNSENYLYNPNFCMPTLTASGANSRLKFLKDEQYRMIQPIEAYQLMGFSKSDFEKVNKLSFLSDQKLIFTAGNSISVEVLIEIFKSILKNYEW